ncbi:MAG: hypothetical protein AB8B86_05890 [Pseudomonadales bacterium]
MVSTVPKDLPGSCLLASVPAATFRKAMDTGINWFSEYNVAAWLGFRYEPQATLALFLRYEDEEGVHDVTVDTCSSPDGLQMMLSGRVQIRTSGDIRSMTVHCDGVQPGFNVRVDELFVQRVEETAALLRRARFAANY